MLSNLLYFFKWFLIQFSVSDISTAGSPTFSIIRSSVRTFNPYQVTDALVIPKAKLYRALKTFSLY